MTIKEAAEKLTSEQALQALNLLRFLIDGCNFVNSRPFKYKDCGRDTGKGFDCASCATRKFFEKLGVEVL